MAKKGKGKTIREAYRKARLPDVMGLSVNDFMSKYGIKKVQIGKETLEVEPGEDDPVNRD